VETIATPLYPPLEDRYSSEPQKAHPTGEFVIGAKFGGHA